VRACVRARVRACVLSNCSPLDGMGWAAFGRDGEGILGAKGVLQSLPCSVELGPKHPYGREILMQDFDREREATLCEVGLSLGEVGLPSIYARILAT